MADCRVLGLEFRVLWAKDRAVWCGTEGWLPTDKGGRGIGGGGGGWGGGKVVWLGVSRT
jgi:hypothetical protein